MNRGQQAWIRIRGAPNDPESFDFATWTGIVWQIERTNSLDDTIYIQIPDYMVVETMPPTAKPDELYHKPKDESEKRR
jgi:hypothetical protein